MSEPRTPPLTMDLNGRTVSELIAWGEGEARTRFNETWEAAEKTLYFDREWNHDYSKLNLNYWLRVAAKKEQQASFLKAYLSTWNSLSALPQLFIAV